MLDMIELGLVGYRGLGELSGLAKRVGSKPAFVFSGEKWGREEAYRKLQNLLRGEEKGGGEETRKERGWRKGRLAGRQAGGQADPPPPPLLDDYFFAPSPTASAAASLFDDFLELQRDKEGSCCFVLRRKAASSPGDLSLDVLDVLKGSLQQYSSSTRPAAVPLPAPLTRPHTHTSRLLGC